MRMTKTKTVFKWFLPGYDITAALFGEAMVGLVAYFC
jgi:hypothetical protein